jgi:hypothetical protein
MAKNLIEVVIPYVVKSRNGVPTVIEWNGNRYVLDHPRHFKPEKKKSLKNINPRFEQN